MYNIYARTATTSTLYWVSDSLFAANIIAFNVIDKTKGDITVDIVDNTTGEVLKTYRNF